MTTPKTAIGTWTRNKGSILVYLPAFRKVGGRNKPYRAKYIGSREEPFVPVAVEKDLKSQFGINLKLVMESPRGGRIYKVERNE